MKVPISTNPHQCLLLFVLFFWPLCTACKILVSRPGIKPVSPAVESTVLTIGLPGNSPVFLITAILVDVKFYLTSILPSAFKCAFSVIHDSDILPSVSITLVCHISGAWISQSTFKKHFLAVLSVSLYCNNQTVQEGAFFLNTCKTV